jgi:hypothetical protein
MQPQTDSKTSVALRRAVPHVPKFDRLFNTQLHNRSGKNGFRTYDAKPVY